MERKSTENYLRTIYYLYEKDKSKGIRSIDIAKELNISKPSVSEMVKKLIKKDFIKSNPYSNIFFTKKGLKEARRVMHNHRIIEVFLKDILNYDLSNVHEEAHKLEHAFSKESIKRLDKFLNNPKKSPFGKKIPHEAK